ncbi:MAG: DUF695 domain-containing protein [Polyangiales bacterium]
MNEQLAIDAFWQWWPTVSDAIAKGFTSGGLSQELITGVSEHVAAIDDRLDWEFGPGLSAQHHLCLSSKGDPVLRVIVERWRRQAPTADATWEFYGARQANPRGGLALKIGEHDLALDEMTLGVEEDEDRERLHLTVDHPAFAAIDDDDLKLRIAFIALDNTLGEDDVERWLGQIDLASERIEAPIALPQLRARVERFARASTGDRWSLLKGTFDGAPLFVLVNTAIKRIDHLLFDTHVTLTIAIRAPTEEGLVTDEEAAVLNAMEDALVESLANEAVFIARETTRGRRVLHFHTMESGPSAAIIARWRERHEEYSIELDVERDPRWEVLRRWM